MKRAIICEGKTDAILISYFLKKRFGWTHIKREVVGLPPVDRGNEERNWYRHPKKPGQELVIWGVGGIDQMPKKLGYVTDRTRNGRTPADRFGCVVLFFDRNNRSEDQCRGLLKEWIKESGLKMSGDLQLGEWGDARIALRKTPEEDYQLHMLSIVLPPDGKGNLEIFLMNCLKEQSCHDRQLVDEAGKFIGSLPDEPYLSKKRYRPKACLGSILSVISPDWVFPEMDERLTRVEWEEIELSMAVYGRLSEL